MVLIMNCPICISPIGENGVIHLHPNEEILSRKHSFHMPCIKSWLERKQEESTLKCPTCAVDLDARVIEQIEPQKKNSPHFSASDWASIAVESIIQSYLSLKCLEFTNINQADYGLLNDYKKEMIVVAVVMSSIASAYLRKKRA
jgi:hypothetical protein